VVDVLQAHIGVCGCSHDGGHFEAIGTGEIPEGVVAGNQVAPVFGDGLDPGPDVLICLLYLGAVLGCTGLKTRFFGRKQR
jgi:hypothetical protein